MTITSGPVELVVFACVLVLSSLAALNDELHSSLQHLRLIPMVTPDGDRLLLSWSDMDDRLDCIEWPIVWSAAQLLASDEVSKIRVCAAKDCGWMYVDRSRNGLRRWCEMETCGSRAKARRHYARAKERSRANH